jgi:hypothetical protein
MDYQVLTGRDAGELQNQVYNYLTGGYKLAGGVAVFVVDGVTYFAQAVTKET